MLGINKKKEEPFEWTIELKSYDCRVTMVQEGRTLFTCEIMKPLFFLRLRMWIAKSKMRFLYYQSKLSQSGFSVVELMSIIAVIGVISTTAVKFTKHNPIGGINENTNYPQRGTDIHISNDRSRRPCESR